MPLDVVIAGAGGSGLKVLQILEDARADGDRGLQLIGFVDDDEKLEASEFFGYPVFGPPSALADLCDSREFGVICPIGDPIRRHDMIGRVREFTSEFPNAIHPSAQVSSRATVGRGNVISQNVVLQAGARVGDFNTLNIAAILGPLATVGDYCTVNATVMLGSGSELGDHSYVGMGAKVMQRVALAPGTVVGANAFVNRPTGPWSTVVGLPGREVRRRDDPFRSGE